MDEVTLAQMNEAADKGFDALIASTGGPTVFRPRHHAPRPGERHPFMPITPGNPMTLTWTGKGTMATEKQVAFLNALLAKRPADSLFAQAIDALSLNKVEASRLIDELVRMPATLVQAPAAAPVVAPAPVAAPRPLPVVPAGRYAVEVEGVVKFYKVDRPTEGRWIGFTFVKVQASDDFYRLQGSAARAILAKIAIDPKAAMLRYGQELGKCGHCGRTLTDQESREKGIGPICEAKEWAS